MDGNYRVKYQSPSSASGYTYKKIPIRKLQEYELKAEALERRLRLFDRTELRPEELKEFKEDYENFNHEICETNFELPPDLENNLRNINHILQRINQQNQTGAEERAEEPQNPIYTPVHHPVYTDLQTNSQGTMVGTIKLHNGVHDESSRLRHNTSFAMKAERTNQTIIDRDAKSQKHDVKDSMNNIKPDIVAEMKRKLGL